MYNNMLNYTDNDMYTMYNNMYNMYYFALL